MTIKQIYLFSAALLCTLVCSFGCHASGQTNPSVIASWKTELGQNVPVLTQPENGPVFAFLCEMRFEHRRNVKNIFDQRIALNTYNLALMKRLPQIVFEALNNHQDQNNRLHRKQIESEDTLNSYNSILGVFEDCLETLRKIDTCIPELFLATDLTAIKQLLEKFRDTQCEYDNWRYKRERARRPISEKISDKIVEAMCTLIPLPSIPPH